MSKTHVSIEAQTLMSDSYRTYFVDVVSIAPDGHASRSNIRSVTDVHLARQIARDIAKAVPCEVKDETLEAHGHYEGIEFVPAA